MDFIEIVFDGDIDVDRDDVEDALAEAFGGIGEVSGAGSGQGRSHLDLEVDPSISREGAIGRVMSVLGSLGVGDSARIRPGDGDVWIRPSEWV